MSLNDSDTQRRLIELLVAEHTTLWHTSAIFKADIKTLVALLPLWVDGIATRAQTIRMDMVEAERRIRIEIPTPQRLEEL
jgi:hypothetical protein